MVSGMVELSLPGMDRTPKEFQDALKAIGELTSHIKTHDLPPFPVKVAGNRIFVKV